MPDLKWRFSEPTIYLCHYPFLVVLGLIFVRLGMTSPMLYFLAAFVGSLALGAVLYYLIKKPILRWVRRFTKAV
ncbi:hypothetical protein Ga0100231_009150 [Opitutaceae bacterium TAV4]|nr:hypothetical protein Ga0100231_008985 [Opitutaceae bacterium TAV4]RRJ94490.1 hypothetical protein Ga0100231_009150 [Opitutaceae bacterium TAV4]RRJ98551.1 hypothetical protein Ga0100230_009240 [Opitutaceae bacterium TAV3]